MPVLPCAVMTLVKFVTCSLFAVLVGACSGGDDPAPLADDTVEAPTTQSTSTGPCTEGAKKSCKVVIAVVDGIENCFVGESSCEAGGKWGGCKKPDDRGNGNENKKDR